MKNDLFELIHTLSKNEKGFFIKFAQQQGKDKIYIDVFKAINDQKEYDRQALIAQFEGKTFNKHLHVTQNYLYNLILKSLRLYHEKHYVELQLYNLLSNAFILEAKGLKKEAAKVLKKAKKIATDHHEYLILLEILKRYSVMVVASKSKEVLKEIEAVYDEIFEIIQILEEEYTYRKLNHSILLCYRQNRQKASHQYKKLLRSISEHKLMEREDMPFSFYAQYLHYNIKCTEARIYGDREIAHRKYKEILKIWEQHPEKRKATPHIFKIHISNYLGNAIIAGNFDDFDHYLEVMEKLPSRNLKERVEAFQNTTYLRLLYFLNRDLLEDAQAFILKIEDELGKYRPHLNPARSVVIYYNILMTYFLSEDYKTAIDWLDKILDEKKTRPRQDIKTFAQILHFIIRFELNDNLMLNSLLNSTSRFISKEQDMAKYEQVILSYFRQLAKVDIPANVKPVLSDFRTALQEFIETGQKPTGIEELLIWLEARIEKQPLRLVYSKKTRK